MVFELPETIKQRLAGQLNPFERFTDLLSGKDDRQDIMITLLYEIASLMAAQSSPSQPSNGGLPSGMLANLSLGVDVVELLSKQEALTTDEIVPQNMADCRRALRVVIFVNNNFNQQISVKIVNNNSNSHAGSFTVHTFNVAAGERGAYGLKWEEWMSYVSCTVTPAVSPTAGSVSAVAVLQQQIEG